MKKRAFLFVILAALVVAFFALDLGRYFNMEALKAQRAAMDAYYHAHPTRTIAIYFIVYLMAAALALPGAVWITLAGGAIFGLWAGTVVVSFASSIGAALSFLISRFLLRDWVQSRFQRNLRAVNEGIRRDGAFYLLTLRLVPLFPFWIVNLVMGVTPMRLTTFYIISQIGMLPATLIYVNAGTHLARIDKLGGILSPALFVSLTLLGIFPLLAKRVVAAARSYRVMRGHKRPARFDRDIVVIGAGSAGLVCAYLASALKASVTLVEKDKMGGDCLNTGCVPSKAFLRSTRLLYQMRHAERYGLGVARVDFDFHDVMQRVRRTIEQIAPHDSVDRYTALGVDCRQGEARMVSPYEVTVGDETLTTRNIIIATGARAIVPELPGLAAAPYSTTDSIWSLQELPRRMAVLGAGPVGCELAQAFARLGSEVTIVELMPQLLPNEDADIADRLQQQLGSEGIHLRLGHRATAVTADDGWHLSCEEGGVPVSVPFDHLLLALGRRARTQGFGVEELGIQCRENGSIAVNEYLQTLYPNVYACGDVIHPYQFTHVAAHEAWFATVNALFGTFRKFKADYSVIPWATFTDPEVARVGLSEEEARNTGINYEVTTFGLQDLDRAILDSSAHGMVKVLTVPGKDNILGAAIVGEHAAEWIIEFVSAMRHRRGLNDILRTVHIYPTFAEANKYVAGAWRRSHAPALALKWLERYHRWRRG